MAQFASTLYQQTNPTNPILLAHRSGFGDAHGVATLIDVQLNLGGFSEWQDERSPCHVLTTATMSQLMHARRVLTRLAYLTG